MRVLLAEQLNPLIDYRLSSGCAPIKWFSGSTYRAISLTNFQFNDPGRSELQSNSCWSPRRRTKAFRRKAPFSHERQPSSLPKRVESGYRRPKSIPNADGGGIYYKGAVAEPSIGLSTDSMSSSHWKPSSARQRVQQPKATARLSFMS